MATITRKQADLEGIDLTIGLKIKSFKRYSEILNGHRLKIVNGREELKPIQEELKGLENELWTKVKASRNSFENYGEGLTDLEKRRFSGELEVFNRAKSMVRIKEKELARAERELPRKEYTLEQMGTDIEDLKSKGDKISDGIISDKQIEQGKKNQEELEIERILAKDKAQINPEPTLGGGHSFE